MKNWTTLSELLSLDPFHITSCHFGVLNFLRLTCRSSSNVSNVMSSGLWSHYCYVKALSTRCVSMLSPSSNVLPVFALCWKPTTRLLGLPYTTKQLFLFTQRRRLATCFTQVFLVYYYWVLISTKSLKSFNASTSIG